MGGLVVKQLLHQAKAENLDNLVNNTIGVVCPGAFLFANRRNQIFVIISGSCLIPDVRCSIVVRILAASLLMCLGGWVLCFALHLLLVMLPYSELFTFTLMHWFAVFVIHLFFSFFSNACFVLLAYTIDR